MNFDDSKYRNIYVFADLHGEFEKFQAILNIIKDNFDLTLDLLIQLGDRNDRGPDTYKINEWLMTQQIMFPDNIIVLNGNHDIMMLDAAKGSSDLMYHNGGNATEKSYSNVTGIYGRNGFGNSLRKSGHYDWIKGLPLFAESQNYFFCHAPICKEKYDENLVKRDFRQDPHALTWTFIDGVDCEDWIDGRLIPKETGNDFKTCVYGHLHNLFKNKKGIIETPNPMKINNAILLDSGCGCSKDAVLSCLELRSMVVIQSDGNLFNIEKKKK